MSSAATKLAAAVNAAAEVQVSQVPGAAAPACPPGMKRILVKRVIRNARNRISGVIEETLTVPADADLGALVAQLNAEQAAGG